MAVKTTYEIWNDEITRPKLTIAQRVGLWFERPASAPQPAVVEPDPKMFEWFSVEEMVERERSR